VRGTLASGVRAVPRPVSAAELVARLPTEMRVLLEGDATTRVEAVAPLVAAGPGTLSLVADHKRIDAARDIRAAVLIVPDGAGAWAAAARLVHPRPRLLLAHVLASLFPASAAQAEVSSQAVVAADAVVDGGRVDAFAVVGPGSRIGAGTHVMSGAVIGCDVRIGAHCVIHPQAVLYDRVVLGDRCIVHSGAVLGADGFGFERDGDRWVKIPQVGSVLVGDDVEIGASTTIDRGALGDTLVGCGVKIDDQVHIGHNCSIGARTMIAGCVGIAGSVTVGEDCLIGGAAMINGHISICDRAVISGGTLVAASISTPGQYTGVFPATDHRTWMRIAGQLRRSGRR